MNPASRMATRRIVSPRSIPLRAAISRPYSSDTQTIPRVKLDYAHHRPPKTGRGEQDAPIIFMHGLFGSAKNNRTVSRVLSRDLGCHVYAVDLRNHGDSPHNSRHDYLAMASDIAGFIEEHGLQNTTLIGHSMGAKTAMTLALMQPSIISSLIAVDNAPVDAVLGHSFGRYIEGLRRIDQGRIAHQGGADKILAEYEPDLATRQFLLGNLHRPRPKSKGHLRVRLPLDTLGKNLGNMGDFPFKDPDEARFEKPALFIRGTKSSYVPDDVIPLIGRFFPRFSLVDIDAGHWLISEKPKEFLKAVKEFLAPKE